MKHLILFSALIAMPFLLSGQCHPDRHSTNWFDGWISCTPSPLPDGSGNQGHWIMYDFGDTYKFGLMTVWNTNDPSHLNWGIRDADLSVSKDGYVWTPVGKYTFAQANGSSIYEGSEGPDLGGVEGRFLLIAADNNYGGECFGLSEIRIEAEEVIISSVNDLASNDCFSISASPNPFSTSTEVLIQSQCPEPYSYAIIDVLGRQVRGGNHNGFVGAIQLNLDLDALPQGTYYLRVMQEEKSAQIALVKFERK